MSIFSPWKNWEADLATERQHNRDRWPAEDAMVAALAEQETPLNDHFEEGKFVTLESVLRYVCALERRVAKLERSQRSA